MNSALTENRPIAFNKAVVAAYQNHSDAEAAVRRLMAGGMPVKMISIIGRNYETREEIQGFYRPADAALSGARSGAWLGGLFGLMLGAFGLFVFPAVGALIVLGPLSGMIAGAVGGAGVGALVNALIETGVPKDHALKYQARLQAGEFLVVVHGGDDETLRAHQILENTGQTHLETHG